MTRLLATAVGLTFFAAGEAKLLRPPTGSRGRLSPSTWRVIAWFELALGALLALTAHPVALGGAITFLVGASAYLGADLASSAREPCNCFGHRHHRRPARRSLASARDALRPTWLFIRNGTLVTAAATALGWSVTVTALPVAAVWLSVTAGTTTSLIRARSTVSEVAA